MRVNDSLKRNLMRTAIFIHSEFSKDSMIGEEVIIVKDIELRVASELMKNSRRSDRQLANAIGVSQPTITRTRRKLEEDGIVKEYTMIPDFGKLGYKILALTFVKLKQPMNQEQTDKAREVARESLKTGPFRTIMLERGIGLDYDGVFMTYHRDYSSYVKFEGWLRQFDFLKLEEIGSFLVNLDDEVRYRPLTFSAIANDLLQMKEKKE
jgi:DNA-binding Lrp family transcriptional regulator